MSHTKITHCSFCSDVEGNLEYFRRYIQYSSVLEWENSEMTALKFKDDHTMFVYGGDSQDKGIGDIRFVNMLLGLKTKYPDRVQWIIGNRDGNKIRLCSELADECVNDPHVLTDTGYPYWETEANRKNTPAAFNAEHGLENTPATRLKWILKHSMGAEGAFDRRREELSIIGNCEKAAISDDAVVQSYRDECNPTATHNFMLQYLREAKVVCVFGRTVFVHGALNPRNIGTVPGKENVETNLRTWVDNLNEWAKQELREFEKNPAEGKTSRQRAGAGLIDYGSADTGNGGRTVTSADFLKDGNSNPIPVAVQQYMLGNNIATVLSGHKPHGDCPNVICTGGVKSISVDTSYSQFGAKSSWGVDNRGTNCVAEVIVNMNGDCEVRGRLADGAEFAYILGGEHGDQFVGRQLEQDKSWIKAKLKDTPEYVAGFGKGLTVTSSRKTAAELATASFVIPETRPQTLYRVDRPLLTYNGPRTDPNSDGEYTGDRVEEYWCGVMIAAGVPLHAHPRPDRAHGIWTATPKADSAVPIRIPDKIKEGSWSFEVTGQNILNKDQWEWRQKGDWGIYAETILADTSRHSSRATALIAQYEHAHVNNVPTPGSGA